MLLLAIETATDAASVAVHEDGRELAAWREVTHQNLLRRLAGEVREALARARREFSRLDLVCVGLGPGSFTSLRVGLATAKGLCLAHDTPIVGIGSLAAMAWQARARAAGLLCPLLDARRSEVYGGLYRADAESVTPVAAEFVSAPANLGERFAALSEPVTVFGQLDRLPVEDLAAAVAGRGALLRDEVILPDAAGVGALGARQFAARGGDDLDALHPIYVRKSYAEEKSNLDLGLR